MYFFATRSTSDGSERSIRRVSAVLQTLRSRTLYSMRIFVMSSPSSARVVIPCRNEQLM
jgi:hypothetical protein